MQAMASTIGYDVLVDALHRSLNYSQFRFQPLWPDAQRKIVESFVRAVLSFPVVTNAARALQVFQALDVIPRTAGLHHQRFPGENSVHALIEKLVSPHNYEPAFCAAVVHKWRSDAVSRVLRARDVLQTGIVKAEQINAGFYARQREDIAKHGLRDCALPSCSKTEKMVKEFAHCSGCRSVVYCCAEHQGLHWTKHKKACREMEAARLAAEEADNEAGAGAAAAI